MKLTFPPHAHRARRDRGLNGQATRFVYARGNFLTRPSRDVWSLRGKRERKESSEEHGSSLARAENRNHGLG